MDFGALPCGYCLKASMTGPGILTMLCIVFTLCSRVRHWDRLWSSIVKGEGELVGCFVLLSTRVTCHPSGLRTKSAMTWCRAGPVDAGLNAE